MYHIAMNINASIYQYTVIAIIVIMISTINFVTIDITSLSIALQLHIK